MTRRVAVPVDTAAPTGSTNVYLLGADEQLLVDPAGRAAKLDEAVAAAEPAAVALTHHHTDHVGGVAAYAEAHELTVWARTGRAEAFREATGVAPDRTFREGSVLPGGVTVIDTPGHAPEHVAFVDGAEVAVGDLAIAESSVVVGAPEGDLRAYLSSLRRLLARDPDRLLPGHGPVVADPAATCRRLIAHRLDRERRVRAAVEDGAHTVEAVLDAAYEKDLSGVRDLARATVRAHLEKLAVEGAVVLDGERVCPARDADRGV